MEIHASTMPVSVVVVVDPYSTGVCLAAEAAHRGFAVLAVWSREKCEAGYARAPLSEQGWHYFAIVEERMSVAETMAAVLQAAGALELVACIVGGETGVTLCDELTLQLGLRGNALLSEGPRRNKNVQQSCVRAAGLRAVREAVGTQWHEVEAFVDSEQMPVVVKPVESASSDGVKLCYSKDEAKAHFHQLLSTQRHVGSQDSGVLVQEFLRGKEYVVDHVSRDGEHKTVNLMIYDKRPRNGADFVYHAAEPLVDWQSEESQQLIHYVRGVLDALGIQNGPTHGEVIMTKDGPCLVEMNCRLIGAAGACLPIQRSLTGGMSQVEATLDAFLNESAWALIPSIPSVPFKGWGGLAVLVSTRAGRVVDTQGLDIIRGLRSCVSMQGQPSVGDWVELSIDLPTNVGLVVLVHTDAQVVEEDMQTIRKMEAEGELFSVEGPGAAQKMGSDAGVDVALELAAAGGA